MSYGLERRAVMVTGATGNLGHAVVRRYVEAGAHVAAIARDPAKAEALRSELGEQAGPRGGGPRFVRGGPYPGERSDDAPRVIVLIADPADRAQMEHAVEEVLRGWGRLDVLVNLAGGFASGPATDVERIQALWEQNVRTAVVAAAACLRPMRARGYGRIVSVASVAALKAGRNNAGYAMAKGAVVRWTEALAAEVKGEGITVNAVLPSTIDHPVNRASMPKADPSTWASPDEVASLILFLSSDEASGVTGAAIPVTART